MQKRLKNCLALLLVLAMLLPMASAFSEADTDASLEKNNTDELTVIQTVEGADEEPSGVIVPAEEEEPASVLAPVIGDQNAGYIILGISPQFMKTAHGKTMQSVAQLLLARYATDGLPVQVYSLTDTDARKPVVISTPQQWNEWVEVLNNTTYNEPLNATAPSENVRDLVYKTGLNAQENITLWLLITDLAEKENLQLVNIKKFLNMNGNKMNFIRFQQESQAENPNWLDIRMLNSLEEYANKNLQSVPLYFDVIESDPLPLAMEILGMNLVSASPTITPEENGDFIWNHDGSTTLIQVTPGETGVQAAVYNPHAMQPAISTPTPAVPDEAPPAETVATNDLGVNIDENAPAVENEDVSIIPVDQNPDENAAKSIDDEPANKVTSPEDTSIASNNETLPAVDTFVPGDPFPLVLNLPTGHTYVLLRNVPAGQYRISGATAITHVAYEVEDVTFELHHVQPEDTLKWVMEEQECTLYLSLPQVAAQEIQLTLLLNGQEVPFATEPITESSDENGHMLKVAIPKQPLSTGTIQFKAQAGGYTVISPVYNYVVEDRALRLQDGNSAAFDYYYNVPGVENIQLEINMAQYFINEDHQELSYIFTSDNFSMNGDVVTFTFSGNGEPITLPMQVTDGHSAPIDFSLIITPIDATALLNTWTFVAAPASETTETASTDTNVQQTTVAENTEANDHPTPSVFETGFKTVLGQPTTFSYSLSADDVEKYALVQAQYPILPAALKEVLEVSAVVTTNVDAADTATAATSALLPYTKESKDNTLLLTLNLPAYTVKTDEITITTTVKVNGQQLNAELIPVQYGHAPNDHPVIAKNIPASLSLKAAIEGSPKARVPLAYTGIQAAEGAELLPDTLIPAQLFSDEYHMEGISVTIKAEPADKVQLYAGETKQEMNKDGCWVLDHQLSQEACDLRILDKGNYKITITANDGQFNSESAIVWDIKVNSPYDTKALIILIAIAVAIIAVIVLLILRQIHKPSFARMQSAINMKQRYSKYPSSLPVATVPLHVYGKKETDLARLFIACQQMPMESIPLEMLEDIALYPEKRHSFRLVLGSKAKELNVVVDNQAQNAQKPITFKENQAVHLYKDISETLDFQIVQNKQFL